MPSLKKNVLYQSAYQALQLLAPLVTTPYVSRVLGPDGVGRNSWTTSIAQYFVLVATLGIADHGSRTIARARADRSRLDRDFSDLLYVHIVVSALALVSYVVFIFTFVQDNRVLFAIQGLWIVAAALDVNWFFSGTEQFGVIVTRNTIVRLVTVGAVFVLVRDAGDLRTYAAILALGTLLGQASVWPFIRAQVTLRRPVWASAAAHVRPLLVLFAPAVAIALFRTTSRVILGAMSSEAELAYFTSAEKIIGIPLGLIWAFAAVMLPRVSNLLAMRNERDVRRLTTTSFRYVWFLSLGLGFGLAGIADEFAPVFFGAEFSATGPLIVAMSATVPFVAFASVIRTQCLIPRSMDRQFMVALFSAAFVSIIANLILVPRFAALGAAVALILAEVTACVAQMVSARRVLSLTAHVRLGAFFLVPGVVMFLVVRGIAVAMEPGVALLVTQIGVGAAIYCAASAAYLWHIRDGVFVNIVRRFGRVDT